MTTTTVEVERTITESEELHLCDECQREVDNNGMEYHPPNYISGGGPTLHFCSECLSDMTDGEVQPAHIKRAEDWLNESSKMSDQSRKRDAKAVRLLVTVSTITAAISTLLTIPAAGLSITFGVITVIIGTLAFVGASVIIAPIE